MKPAVWVLVRGDDVVLAYGDSDSAAVDSAASNDAALVVVTRLSEHAMRSIAEIIECERRAEAALRRVPR